MGSTPTPPPLTPNIYYTSPQSSIKIDRNLAEGVFGVGPAETGLKVVYYNAHRVTTIYPWPPSMTNYTHYYHTKLGHRQKVWFLSPPPEEEEVNQLSLLLRPTHSLVYVKLYIAHLAHSIFV